MLDPPHHTCYTKTVKKQFPITFLSPHLLSPIIVEEARNRNNLLPVPLLHLIIQYGENVLNEFFEKYLEMIIKNYIAFRKAYDEQFKKWLEMGMDLSSFQPQKMPHFSAINSFLDLFSKSATENSKEE